ncbi:MAG: hypothetical protein WC852_07095 [Candidatus Nanoarchaeia archaeon]|jgi:hypothetical protein
MDALFKQLCKTLEVVARDSANGTNLVEEVESQTGKPIGSLYLSVFDTELYARVKKHIKTYLFRESMLNSRKVSIVVEDKFHGTLYTGHFPPSSDDVYFDFVEDEKVNEHIAAL